MYEKPLIIAHRGFRGKYPENTMLAFEKAITEGGSHGVELDVQCSVDGTLVVIHDDTVNRTTNGSGAVEAQTLTQLQALNAGGDAFSSERIPTLTEVLDLAKEMGFLVNIELKYSPHQHYQNLAQQAIALVREFRLEEQILFSSFHPLAAIYCARQAPEMKTGLLYSKPDSRVLSFVKLHGIHALHPHFSVVQHNPMLVRGGELLGVHVNAWTVNDMDDMTAMMQRGVYSIITDHPDRLANLLRQEPE